MDENEFMTLITANWTHETCASIVNELKEKLQCFLFSDRDRIKAYERRNALQLEEADTSDEFDKLSEELSSDDEKEDEKRVPQNPEFYTEY